MEVNMPYEYIASFKSFKIKGNGTNSLVYGT
jgi:hypothetical protein